MARVVNDTITLINRYGAFLKTVEISNKGLSIENARFMIDYAKKDLDSFILDLFFFNDIIDYINSCKLDVGIKDFDEFKKKFTSVFVKYRDKYPNKFNRLLKEYQKCSKGFGFNFQIVNKFIDHKFDMVAFFIKTDQGLLDMQQVPLVPEVADRFYDITLYQESKCDVKGSILSLYEAKVYYYEYLDRYVSEEMLDKVTKLEKILAVKKQEYPDDYKFIVDHFAYQTGAFKSVCNDPQQFIIYILNKLLKDKKMQDLLDIEEMLFQTVDLEYASLEDYDRIFERLSGFILYLGLQDEYYCLTDMTYNFPIKKIIEIFSSKFREFEATLEYQELKEEYLGDDRTHD